MPKVIFFPAGREGEVPNGISLLDAAEKLGITLRHDCGGFATCSTCRVWVQDGMAHLSEIDLDEENMLEEAALSAPYRLSCQAKILGDVIVRIEAEEMDWSRSALLELDALSVSLRKTVRMMVEQRARRQGISAILPDVAIPYVAAAKQEIEAVSDDPARLSELMKQIYEGSYPLAGIS